MRMLNAGLIMALMGAAAGPGSPPPAVRIPPRGSATKANVKAMSNRQRDLYEKSLRKAKREGRA